MADKLLDFFADDQLDFACSTSFYVGSSNLPDDNIINLYKKVTKRLDVIGCSADDSRYGVFGDVCYRFKPGSRNVHADVGSFGVAVQVK